MLSFGINPLLLTNISLTIQYLLYIAWITNCRDSFQCMIPKLVKKIPLFANFHNHVFTNAKFLHFLDRKKSLSSSRCSISNFSKLSPQKKCIFSMIEKMINVYIYRIVASSNPSRIEAHAGLFRLLMKGIFDPYVLWPFDKKLIF